MSIALLIYLTSLLLPNVTLVVAMIIFSMILLIYFNQKPYTYLIVSLIVMLSSLQPHFTDEITGLVVSQDADTYRILTLTHSVSVKTSQHLELDVIVNVKGDFKINNISNKKHYQTFFSPIIESKLRIPSLRRLLWNSLNQRPKIQSIIFSKYDENESVLASQGWYLSGLLIILKWCFKPIIGSSGVLKLRRILTSFYFIFMSQSISIFRVFIGSFFKVETQIIVILCLFPNLNRSGFFYLVYGPWIFTNLHTKLKEHTGILRMMLISSFLNKLNIVEITMMPVLKVYAGLQLILASLSILIPEVPYEIVWVESLLAKIKSIPLEILGHISFGCILIFCFLIIKKRRYGMCWLILVYCFIAIDPITTVTFINVGQGDATLFKYSFNQEVVLIDTGKPSAYFSLKRELERKGVRSIDTLVITHDDLDHSGNYDRVMIDYKVKRSVWEKNSDINGFELFLKERDFGDINDNSLILRSNLDIMFTGDAGILQEYLLSKNLDTRSKILKLGHHGSKTSSSKKYLLHNKPKIAIISSDPNSYGHPHIEVLKNLYDTRIPYLQTSNEGSITFYFVGNICFFTTENGRFGIV